MNRLRATSSFLTSSVFVVGCAFGDPNDIPSDGAGGFGGGPIAACGGLPQSECQIATGGVAVGAGGFWTFPEETGGCASGGASSGGAVSSGGVAMGSDATGGYGAGGGYPTGGYAETGGAAAGGSDGTGGYGVGGSPAGGSSGYQDGYFQAWIPLGLGIDEQPELSRFDSMTMNEEYPNLEHIGSCYWKGDFEFTKERFPDAVFRVRIDGVASSSLSSVAGGEHVVVAMRNPPLDLTPWKSELYAPLPAFVTSKFIDLDSHTATLPKNRSVRLKFDRAFPGASFEVRAEAFACFGSEEIEIPRAILGRLEPGTLVRVSQTWTDDPEVLGGPLHVHFAQPVVGKDGTPIVFSVGE